jgi:hypothetical protein
MSTDLQEKLESERRAAIVKELQCNLVMVKQSFHFPFLCLSPYPTYLVLDSITLRESRASTETFRFACIPILDLSLHLTLTDEPKNLHNILKFIPPSEIKLKHEIFRKFVLFNKTVSPLKPTHAYLPQSTNSTFGRLGLFAISQFPSHSTDSSPRGFSLHNKTRPFNNTD